MKLQNDKYYTPIEIANHCWDKVFEVIGEENISEIIEPKSGVAASTVFEHELTQDIIDTLKSKRKAKLAEIKAGESSSQTAEGFQKNTSTPAPQTTYNPFAQQQ